MIQRIQTLLLLGVAICMGLFFAYYVWGERNDAENKVILMTALKMEVIDTAGSLADTSDDEVIQSEHYYHIAISAMASLIVALISIFKYKNRLTQMKLGALNALLMATTLGLTYYKMHQYEHLINPETRGSIQLGFFLPAVAMLLNIFSNRFIRKDEKLVKSVERVR